MAKKRKWYERFLLDALKLEFTTDAGKANFGGTVIVAFLIVILSIGNSPLIVSLALLINPEYRADTTSIPTLLAIAGVFFIVCVILLGLFSGLIQKGEKD